ncbi:NUDIX domain-containing protein [Tropicibacter alexandrii]|uniref:NUDIX domain-containing protein n=1 Tax=Tropicibacter alexandrii TaxID=2267683 RepID=UPI001F0C5044|nr:NUDIX domain-containing protein [Tropicibacter alexandrii]
MAPARDFIGAKVMVFAGDRLLVLRRDHTPGIPWPGKLDFPGGGREGTEDAATCVLRETFEELCLRLDPTRLRFVENRVARGSHGVFFAYHGPLALLDQARFGGEGDGWGDMAPMDYVNSPDAIPPFAAILGRYLSDIE